MRHAPLLSCVLWTTIASGCDSDPVVFVDAAAIDAAADGPAADASLATATFAPTLTLSADCGVASPSAVDLAITNTGAEPLVISAASATGGFAVTTTLPLTIGPAASGNLAVRPPAAVIGTDLGGQVKTGVLSFTTNETGAPARTVDLSSTVNGANLILEDAGGEAITMLGFSVTSACPGPQNLRVHNTGNRPATVTNPSASGFGFGGFSPSSLVAAGQRINHDVSVFTLGPCAGTAQVSYQATGTLCTATPRTLTATFSIGGGSGSCFCS